MNMSNFAVFIPSFGRPGNVKTWNTLRKQNYTGDIFIVCSDDDESIKEYKETYNESVIVFNKQEYNTSFDICDNITDNRAVVYARNAIFDIAKQRKIHTFLVLDDDYSQISYRLVEDNKLIERPVINLNSLFFTFCSYLHDTTLLKCICFAQNGDYIGGKDNTIFRSINRRRKIMNSFFCRTDRPFKFNGRINEDVNCYTDNGKRGDLYLTHPSISINQMNTQQNTGGLTDIYMNLGTYVKSFYSVIMCPSSVKIKIMGESHKRLHHNIKWDNAIPKLISETWKK